ncbi:c-type cytochrome [Vibrio diabolicus]|uniref:c-type cytochrome n=1 Tax=Vibrio diabolicus TaxID=50719 RepID=UPI00211B6100|nr:c-type cytochrome [Vibrio diabolicus]MCG9227784.1 c-type cytochrome [Vibrio diabolicus]MCG9570202.1 c-type cytochrome [Vibrio diabolicus]MCG9590799.1 c-type cytochrome [Vibrio diabolicus]MCG9775220.1 c-type cytochrome [Vibrio diabolicus]
MKATFLNERGFPLSFTFLALLSYSALANNDELIAAGEQQAMVCKACHQFEPNGVSVVGPPLWGLAERDIASFASFNYSEAIKQHQGQWDAEKLDAFLASPSGFAPGTNMVFPGVKDPGARAAIIAWLATKNPTPPDWNTTSSEMEVKSPGDGILRPRENMELVAAVCSACHSLHMVTQQGLSRQRWDETLDWMIEEQGMDELPGDDREAILKYLSTYYGGNSRL